MCDPEAETKVPFPHSPSSSGSTPPFQLHPSTSGINPNIVKRMQGEKCYSCGHQGHWSWYCPENNNRKSLSLSPSPNIVKRMESENCYTCGQQGHWSWYCPENNNNNRKSLSLSPSPNIVKRMESENCYTCGQQGHWSWYCPLNSPNNNNTESLSFLPNHNHSPVSSKLIHCRCGHGFCVVKTAHSEENWGRNYFVCPVKRGARCKHFVKWCDDPIDESDLQPPLLKYPQCKCGAGVCRRLEETMESSNGVRYYFACPIKQGHGSCGYRVSEDELLNSTSIDPIQQSRQRSPHEFFKGCQNDITSNDLGHDLGEGSDLLLETNRMRIMDISLNPSSVAVSEIHEEKDVSFSGSEVADHDLEVTNLVSSCLPTPSRIGHRQSLFQRDVFAADASFGIFPSFDPIVVPKQTSISNRHSECNNPAINKLSTACDIEISKDVVSPNKSLSSERKLMSKVQRQREVVLFTQQRLLSDLESFDPHKNESMREAAETTFARLNLLGVECEQFSDHIWDFINLASSMAKTDKSIENSPTLEEHNKFIEEEKVRMAHIHDDYIKTEALLEVSSQQRKLLREQVSHLEAMLHEKQNELKSCELETTNIETKLGDLKRSMLEVDITLKDRVRQAEIAREESVERYTERIAAKAALEKAKLALEN